jgi:hypothetical protein
VGEPSGFTRSRDEAVAGINNRRMNAVSRLYYPPSRRYDVKLERLH